MLKTIKDSDVDSLVKKLNQVDAYTISINYVEGVWVAVYKDDEKKAKPPIEPKQKRK